MELPKLQAKILLEMLLSLERSSTCIFLPPISTFVTKPDLVTAAAPKPIIVRFKSHKKKTELYKARKHLKSVSLNQYFHATNVVYVDENLTYLRRKLFAKVR